MMPQSQFCSGFLVSARKLAYEVFFFFFPLTVLIAIGGGFQFGGSGTFFYDGTSFAQNQDVILVSFNYVCDF